jgi:hypothetical protein
MTNFRFFSPVLRTLWNPSRAHVEETLKAEEF